jgi:hypothetical protein
LEAGLAPKLPRERSKVLSLRRAHAKTPDKMSRAPVEVTRSCFQETRHRVAFRDQRVCRAANDDVRAHAGDRWVAPSQCGVFTSYTPRAALEWCKYMQLRWETHRSKLPLHRTGGLTTKRSVGALRYRPAPYLWQAASPRCSCVCQAALNPKRSLGLGVLNDLEAEAAWGCSARQ